tara:strand:- start:183 stop:467 length:285 start_codon:yes stop_codon:yes gene_type:complete
MTGKDILKLIACEKDKIKTVVCEDSSIPIFAGTGGDKFPLIGDGFKIRHKDSGLTYTCSRFIPDDKKSILIVIDDSNGDYYAIPGSDFPKYERM